MLSRCEYEKIRVQSVFDALWHQTRDLISDLYLTLNMPKELTRHQLSSRLAYSQGTPAFLQRLKGQVSGASGDSIDNKEDEFDSWQASSGRPPIPRRPIPPSRPEGEPGSDQEDADDEKPQVVVLKEGKHLTAEEAENERRKGVSVQLCA